MTKWHADEAIIFKPRPVTSHETHNFVKAKIVYCNEEEGKNLFLAWENQCIVFMNV